MIKSTNVQSKGRFPISSICDKVSDAAFYPQQVLLRIAQKLCVSSTAHTSRSGVGTQERLEKIPTGLSGRRISVAS